MNHLIRTLGIALGLAWVFALPAQAHEKAHPHTAAASTAADKEQKDWGMAGDAAAVKRTVTIVMDDKMRFSPNQISVRQGETLRLLVRNRGKLLHELVIGTRQELDAHAAMMAKHPGMEHDEPYMAHVDAGKTGELIWHFNRPGDFAFACLINGHYQAGMTGTIRVSAATAKP